MGKTVQTLLISAVVIFATTVHAADTEEFFRAAVEPILVGQCLECHAGDRKGGLDLREKSTTMAGGKSGAVIVPGDAEASLLYQYVRDEEMPPKHPLSTEQRATIQQWITDGA